MSSDAHARTRLNTLVSMNIALAESDFTIIQEICDNVRRGRGEVFLDVIKEPLRNGTLQQQLRALSTIEIVADNSNPTFAVLLSTDRWIEKLYKTAKETGSVTLRERIMEVATLWAMRYGTSGFNGLVEHFERSSMKDQYSTVRTRVLGQRRGSNSTTPTATPTTRTAPTRDAEGDGGSSVSVEVVENFLLEAQSDLTHLEYVLENETTMEPGAAQEAARNCIKQRDQTGRYLKLYRMSGSAKQQLTALLEQLEQVLEFYAATAPAAAARLGLAGIAAGERPPPLPRAAPSSGAATAALTGSANAELQRLLDSERSENRTLRGKQDEMTTEIEKLKTKYKEVKEKNREAVEKLVELMDENEALKQHSDGAGGATAAPQIITKVERVRVSAAAVEKVRNALLNLKQSCRSLRTEAQERRKDSDVGAAQVRQSLVLLPQLIEREGSQARELYKREHKLRKYYYNLVQELKGNIRVYCRVRPISKKELDGGHSDVTAFPSEEEIRINDERGGKVFEFDSVYKPDSQQEQVFADTRPLIDSVIDGYNVCIFAYGQTGSGKTHTMNGTPENPGINRRALLRLFECIAERSENEESTVTASVLEIYNEAIRDLLVSKAVAAKTQYDIRQNGPFGQYVTNLTDVPVRSATDIDDIMARAQSHRSEAATNMNLHSSRSHMILYVIVKTKNRHTGVQSYGKMSLIDLAGSERLDKSEVQGQAAKEAMAINKSLSALGDVIAGLSTSAKHIPFRNSTLTYLLQDSMAGQAKVLMFCCVSPASYNAPESVSSLGFASRARGVSLGQVKKNMLPS
jgi:kinesin family protein C2/C3